MSTTPNPMLEALERLSEDAFFLTGDSPGEPITQSDSTLLRAFLSRPEVAALQDPGTAAALRVLLEGWPKIERLQKVFDRAKEGNYDKHNAWSEYANEASDLVDRAAQAKREAESQRLWNEGGK